MERTDSQWRELLAKHKVPFDLEGTVLEVQFRMGWNDWYVRTDRSWYWWDGKQWKSSVYGPTT